MAEATTGTTVPNAFAAPPRMAAQFRDRFMQSEAGAEQAQTPTSHTVESQHVENPTATHQAQPNPLDKPFVDQPQEQPQPVQPQPVPPQPVYNPDQDMLRGLAAERDALRQELARMQTQMAQWEQDRANQQLANDLYNAPELGELESVDPEDARRIAGAVTNVVNSRLSRLQNELQEQRAAQARGWQAMQQREQMQFERATAEKVLRQHPDFFNLYQNSPEFRQFLAGHDGYSSKTREQQALEEFHAGNPDYVVDMLNRFKSGRPNGESVTSVAPVQVAGVATAQTGETAPQPNYTLADLNNLMQTRQITQDEYRERLKAWRAANSR